MTRGVRANDLTDAKHLKRALLLSENNFSQLFNSNYIPQWIYEADSLRLLIVNDAAIKLYGYSAKEFLNMTILQIVPQDEVQKMILYNEFLKTTNEPFTVINFHQNRSSESLLVETTYINLHYNNRSCVLVSSVDISDRIKYDEKISLAKVMRQQKITLSTVNGQENERGHIGKELHDNISQLLVASKIYLGLA